jgi:hypothetical protein
VPSLSPFVIVKGAPDQFSDLVGLIRTFNIKSGIQNSLDAKLQNAFKAYQVSGERSGNSLQSDGRIHVMRAMVQTGQSLNCGQAAQRPSARVSSFHFGATPQSLGRSPDLMKGDPAERQTFPHIRR